MENLGKILRDMRKKMGKSQIELACMLEIPQTTWSNYEVGKAQPPLKILVKLAEMGYPIPGLTTGVVQDLIDEKKISKAEFHRRMEIAKNLPPNMNLDDFNKIAESPKNTSDIFLVPLLDQKLSAGKGSNLPDNDQQKTAIPAPSYLSSYGENIAALSVDGDSMEPTLSRGDMVICDSCGWSGEGIYAVRLGGSGFVKRITKAPGKVVILSDNPRYPPREEPEESQDFELIGRVHCAIKKME